MSAIKGHNPRASAAGSSSNMRSRGEYAFTSPVGSSPRLASSAPAVNATGRSAPSAMPPQRTSASWRHSFQSRALNMRGLLRMPLAEQGDEDLLERQRLDRDLARAETAQRRLQVPVGGLGGHGQHAAVGEDVDRAFDRSPPRSLVVEHRAAAPDARLERL